MVSGAAQSGRLRTEDPRSRHAPRPGQTPDSTRRWIKLGGNVTSNPSFFTFFYYSFNNLFFNQIREISPVAPVSQIMSMAESFSTLFLITIFVSLAISVRNQRASEELGEAIESIETDGRHIETFIRDEYRFSTIDDAMAELQRAQAGLGPVLVRFRRDFSGGVDVIQAPGEELGWAATT
jgi:hypothetical protein